MKAPQAILRHIDMAPDARAIHAAGRWRTRDWLRQGGDALAPLLAGAHRVGLVSRNRPQHVATLVANLLAGRTTTMIYSALGPKALATEVVSLGLDALVADSDDWFPGLAEACTRAGVAGIALDDTASTLHARIVVPAATPQRPGTPPVGPAIELLSSGTTGNPRRIPMAWEELDRMVEDARQTYAGTQGSTTPQVMVHPLGNISGIVYCIPPLAHGQAIVLLEKFATDEWAQAVRIHRPERATLPPAALAMVLESEIVPADLSSLRLIAVGGGKLDPEVQKAFEDRFSIPVLTAFGATEFGGVVAGWTLDSYREWGQRKTGSAGRAVAGASLRVVSPEDARCLPAGEVGLLEAKVPRTGCHDWIRTNDLVSLDKDGFLFVHGRADGAINRGGFKIVPEAVTSVIEQHPDVAEAAVVGITDERLGEVPVAAVVIQPGARLAENDLRNWLRERLLAYQVPVRYRFVEALPRNLSMKVAIGEVKALFQCD